MLGPSGNPFYEDRPMTMSGEEEGKEEHAERNVTRRQRPWGRYRKATPPAIVRELLPEYASIADTRPLSGVKTNPFYEETSV